MGLLLDVVPNHMGADPCNTWWRDVLENGENSRYAKWFDIDWHPPNLQLAGRVLLPILGSHYAKELEGGKLRVMLEPDGFALAYYEHKLPLSPGSIAVLEDAIAAECQDDRGNEFSEARAHRDVLRVMHEVPHGGESEGFERRSGGGSGLPSEERAALESALRRFNGDPGVARTFDRLHALLQQQHYRLACWRLANQQINYRRFFDVSELVCLRMELQEVFETTHRLVFTLIRDGRVTGLRIDHVDGLWNPKEYFDRLQTQFVRRAAATSQDRTAGRAETQPGQGTASAGQRLYVVAEKILSRDEELPADWRISGTTGYDFLNQLNGLFVNSANEPALDAVYRQFTGSTCTFEDAAYCGKKRILHTSMRADLHALAVTLQSIAAQTRYGMDFGLEELQRALAAVIAAFPVYRTYITEESHAPTSAERAQILTALAAPHVRAEVHDSDILSFIGDLLTLSPPADLDGAGRDLCRNFVMRFQQLTGPVMAKGVEDTAFYNYNRFISRNEVGGSPDQFGTSLTSFHEQTRRRAEKWPHTLVATATHDTKRGEDLRARLNVLSEMPEEWGKAVLKWRGVNADKKTCVDAKPAPDPNDEYLIYQTLIGVWEMGAESAQGRDAFLERLSNYIRKAIRESKTHTHWTEPNVPYEAATEQFIHALLSDSKDNSFLHDFMLFQRKVAFFGLFNSLTQVALKLTAPGVPDLYQGTELWDYNMVDPDNRRPVDYQRRRMMLAEMRRKLGEEGVEPAILIKGLLQNHQNGQIKMYLVWKILQMRRRNRSLFERGAYLPIEVVGAKREHLCAFARRSADGSVVTLAARLVSTLSQGAQRGALDPDIWQDTTLVLPGEKPETKYRDVLTEQVIASRPNDSCLAVRDILGLLPVAVLERIG
jgi:(1->4)-alpha-D-glucan 1-alpha-D-glucosylmutase